jgi:parallel beta-helix repeat protein
MALLVYESSSWTYNWTIPDDSVWNGVSPPKSEQTEFIFRNNLIESDNTAGYMLQAGIDPFPPTGYNNTLDGEIISGNVFKWNDPDPGNSWWSITHGLFTGHERNAYIKYNYLDQVPMAIIRKSCNLITDTSGGVFYNIVNGGGVAVNIKGLSGVRVYNNTLYGNRSVASGETWRPLIYIYTNTDTCASGTGGSPASDTKIKNNIFYTEHDQHMINIADASCAVGFESDYNVFWKEGDGSIRFNYLGSELTFEGWQALGYDVNSVVMDPSFIDVSTFVPRVRLDYGTTLSSDYSTGLSINASWGTGYPSTTAQNGVWQVGAMLYEADAPIESSTYYVSSSGNDASDGKTINTAWKTIDKVNASMGNIEAGETILFRKGDTFYGTLNITKSGTAGNPITFGAYSTGEDPKITGFTTITSGWTNEGSGVYSRDISADQQTNMVVIDGSQYGMGRYPKGTTYLTYESHDGSLSITDNQLANEPNWTGADVVIRQTYWLQGRYKIIEHDGSTIVYNDGSRPDAYDYIYDNMGYFFQNDLSTLYMSPTYGEWYHDTISQKLYVYFGSDPGSTEVKVATKGNLFQGNTYDYLTLNNLSFIGCTSTAVNFTEYNCSNITITDCSIKYAGLSGISDPGANTNITNNTIDRCNESGIRISGADCTINYNKITNIGLIAGQGYHGEYATGIRIGSTNTTVYYNRIENMGYCGISGGSGSGAAIRYNFINNHCLTVNDGGGIYRTLISSPHHWDIESNIILNGYGNTNGTSNPTAYIARGIYLDSFTTDASVRYNTCANNRGTGIMLGSAHNNTVEHNLCYNNGDDGEGQLYASGSWDYASLYGNIIRYNQFIAKSATQYTLGVSLTASDNITNYGTSNYNIYARPIDDNITIRTYKPGEGTDYKTLAEWQTYSSQDANSQNSYTIVSSTNELLFYYNETNANKIVASLIIPMVDVSGNIYPVGNLTLAPWTSIVLMPNSSVNVYYISSDGSDGTGDGTISSPWFTLNRAWQDVSAGDIIYMRGGTYEYHSSQILTGKNGTADASINIWAYPGETPVFIEASTFTFPDWPQTLVRISGNYIYLKGLEIAYCYQTPSDNLGGFTAYQCLNSTFELLNIHHCGGGGQLLSSGDCLVLNSDFHHNYDPYDTAHPLPDPLNDAYGDADGLGVQDDGVGTVNTVRGCRFWNNSDDGIDLWYSQKMVIIENCWSWNNGYREDGVTEGGDGNGYKLGPLVPNPYTGHETEHLRTIENCLAFNNRTAGLTQNAALCIMHINNVTSYNNNTYGFQMMDYGNCSNNIQNCIAYDNSLGSGTFSVNSSLNHNTFLYNNTNNPVYSVSDGDFTNLSLTGLDASRNEDGSLPTITFLHLAAYSDLIYGGVDVSGLIYDAEGKLWNSPPSLGAYEYGEEPSTGLPFVSTTSITDISTYTATGGGNVTHDGSIALTYRGICWNTATSPTIANPSTLAGTTGEGSYVSYLTELNASTHYYVRAFAYNTVGLSYGSNVEFNTLGSSTPSEPSAGANTSFILFQNTLISYGGFFLKVAPTGYTPPTPEPSTVTIEKETGAGYSVDGTWAFDEYCPIFGNPCAYDISIGIITTNPGGHFTVVSEIPNWICAYDTLIEQDLSVGDHVSDTPGRVIKIHPITENNTGYDRDGSLYITNDFGGSVTYYLLQYKEPVPPIVTLAIDPSDESGMDISTYDSATLEAGMAVAIVQGLYITVPGWNAGDLDVSWRGERTVPSTADYGVGSFNFEHNDVSFSGGLTFSDSAHNNEEFVVYLLTDPRITLYRTPTSKNFLKSGGDVSINVTTDIINTWNASESYDWLSLTNESSSGDGQFIITAEQQPDGGLRRNATVYINSLVPTRTVTISQDPSVYLTFVPSTYTFGDAGGQHDVSVVTNVLNPWEASTAATWLSFAGSPSGTGSGNLTLWADPQPTAGAAYRDTTVGGYSEASTAILNVDQEYLSFTEFVEMQAYTFLWYYNTVEEQYSTVTTSYSSTTPHWIITNAESLPDWLTWGVYDGASLEASDNYQSGFILRANPSTNAGYTARTTTFDISSGSGLSSKTITVWQGPAPQPVSATIDSSGFTCTTNSIHAYVNSPYISFSVTDFDGWNTLYGSGNACNFIIIDASSIVLISETLLELHAQDADATNYVITDANLGRNAIASDELTVILYGTPV